MVFAFAGFCMLIFRSMAGAQPKLTQTAPHWEWSPKHARWNLTLKYFNQTANHFNAYGQNATFLQRYLVDLTSWGGAAARAPLFFFTGAEGGDVEAVAGGYGHIQEIAQRLRGGVVFMEGRFFGKSWPFGSNDSFDPSPGRVGLLSVEEMLVDYVKIISSIRDELDPTWACPTVSFGGSLAGTLSAMLRLKYPHVIDMSLASSAPLRGYPLPGIDQFAWRRQVTQNWITLSTEVSCPIVDLVRHSFAVLQDADPIAVQRAFNTCEPAYPGNWQDAQGVVWQVLEGDAEFVYPASASPIPQICEAAMNVSRMPGKTALDVAAALLYPQMGCTNLTRYRMQAQRPDAKGWDYLACTEIVHPIGCNNITDTSAYCKSTWRVQPMSQGLWIPQEFGFEEPHRLAASASRIIFAYGELDPWHVFAISNKPLSDLLPVIMIPSGSHCADMQGSRPDDTIDMKAARNKEEAILASWLTEVQNEHRARQAHMFV